MRVNQSQQQQQQQQQQMWSPPAYPSLLSQQSTRSAQRCATPSSMTAVAVVVAQDQQQSQEFDDIFVKKSDLIRGIQKWNTSSPTKRRLLSRGSNRTKDPIFTTREAPVAAATATVQFDCEFESNGVPEILSSSSGFCGGQRLQTPNHLKSKSFRSKQSSCMGETTSQLIMTQQQLPTIEPTSKTQGIIYPSNMTTLQQQQQPKIHIMEGTSTIALSAAIGSPWNRNEPIPIQFNKTKVNYSKIVRASRNTCADFKSAAGTAVATAPTTPTGAMKNLLSHNNNEISLFTSNHHNHHFAWEQQERKINEINYNCKQQSTKQQYMQTILTSELMASNQQQQQQFQQTLLPYQRSSTPSGNRSCQRMSEVDESCNFNSTTTEKSSLIPEFQSPRRTARKYFNFKTPCILVSQNTTHGGIDESPSTKRQESKFLKYDSWSTTTATIPLISSASSIPENSSEKQYAGGLNEFNDVRANAVATPATIARETFIRTRNHSAATTASTTGSTCDDHVVSMQEFKSSIRCSPVKIDNSRGFPYVIQYNTESPLLEFDRFKVESWSTDSEASFEPI